MNEHFTRRHVGGPDVRLRTALVAVSLLFCLIGCRSEEPAAPDAAGPDAPQEVAFADRAEVDVANQGRQRRVE